ncbi:unnamed protein product, partial [Symbiodinium microadriaticum]
VLKVYHRKHKLEVGDRSTQENLKLRQALMQDLEDSDKAKLQASRSPIGLQIKALYVYLARNKQPDVSEDRDNRVVGRKIIELLDNAFQKAFGWGISEYLPERPVRALHTGETRYFVSMVAPGEEQERRRSCIDHGNGQRSFELPHKIVDGRVHAPVLHLSADQAAGGFQGLNWLVHGLQLRATHCWDLFHRIHNDWIDALQESGLLLIRLEYRNVVKLRHGPYKGQGNHEVLRSAAAEFFECCSHENVLFQLLYDDIVQASEHLRSMPNVGTDEHMQYVWEWARRQHAGRSCGSDPKRSRWWQFETASAAAIDFRYLDLLVLVWLGCRRKWWKTTDNPLLSISGLDLEQNLHEQVYSTVVSDVESRLVLPPPINRDMVGEDVQEDAAEPLPGAPEASADAGIVKVVKATGIPRGGAPQEGDDEPAALLLRFADPVRLWKSVARVPAPLQLFFADSIAKVLDFHISMAEGSLLQVCQDLFTHFFSSALAESMELRSSNGCGERSAKQQMDDETVLNSVWQLLVRLVGDLVCTASVSNLDVALKRCLARPSPVVFQRAVNDMIARYKMPPLSLLTLISPEPAVVSKWLAKLQAAWTHLESLEALAADVAEAQWFCTNLLVPRQQYAREILVRLLEADFKEVPSSVRVSLQQYASSHLSTLLVEWHVASFGSKTMAEFERQSLPITSSARSCAPKRVASTGLFFGANAACSIAPHHLEHLQCDQPDWPNFDAKGFKTAAIMWQLLEAPAATVQKPICKSFHHFKAQQGDWRRMECAWFSLLLTPGTLAVKEAVAARGKVNWSSALLAAIRAFRMGKPDIDEDDDEESLMDNDEDVQKQFEKLKERHAAAKVREQARLEKLEPLLGADSAKPAKPSRSVVPFLMTGYPEKEARKFMPPGSSIYKDLNRENRWRVRSKWWPEKTKSYGSGSAVTDWGAMKICILHAWAREKARVGAECPFDFQDEDGHV